MSDRSSVRSVQAHGLRGWGPRDGEGLVAAVAITGVVAAVAMTGHVASALRKQREMNADPQLTFFLFIQSRTPAHGALLPTFKVVFPRHLT